MTQHTEEPMRIGWVGAGRMGVAMARRIRGGGYDLAVTNRTRAKAEVLTAVGATVVDAPSDLSDRDVVFTMVSASADLEAVITGPGGLLSGEGSVPGVIVDCSTVSAETSANVRLAATKRGARFLAAPVSGNPKVVRAGKLTLAVSGPQDAFDTVEPLLRLLGRGVTYVGDGEMARLVKICHNVLLGVVTQSLAEITVLAERGGVSRTAFLEFLNNSVMGSTFTRYKSPAFVKLDFSPTFTLPLLRKDFDLGLAAAREMEVPMPMAALCAQIVGSAIGAGYHDEDFAVLLLEQARAAGLELQPEDADVPDGLEEEVAS
jgi:3-hydroxyisobutyrate dehydrogenase